MSAPATAGAASSCATNWSATAINESGALTINVPVRRSLVTSTWLSPPGMSRRARVVSTCLRSELTWSVRPLFKTYVLKPAAGTPCNSLTTASTLANAASSPVTISVRLADSTCTVTSGLLRPATDGAANAPLCARPRILAAILSRSPRSIRQVRTPACGGASMRSSCATIASNCALRSPGHSTITVLVAASALMKMSFCFCKCGSGRPRASSGMGGCG